MFLGVSLLDTSIMILFAAGRACLACNLCEEEEEEVLIFLALFAPRAGGALSTYLKWVGLF